MLTSRASVSKQRASRHPRAAIGLWAAPWAARYIRTSGPTLVRGAGILGLAILVQLPTHDRGVVALDEGQLLTVAGRFLTGDLLYKDIHTGIFPGVYYLAALVLWAFGHDVIVVRWAQVLVNALMVLFLWRLALRIVRPYWAVIPPVLYLGLVVTSFPCLTMFHYSAVSLVAGVGGLLFLLRYSERAQPIDGAAVGLLLGICALTKQNFGMLALIAIVAGFLGARAGADLGRRSLVAGLTPIVIAGTAISVVGLGYLAVGGAFPAFLEATGSAQLASQLAAYNDPIPPIFGSHPAYDGRFLFLYAPPIMFNYATRGEALFGQPILPGFCHIWIRLAYGGMIATLATGPLVLWLSRKSDSALVRRQSLAVVLFALLMFLGIFPSSGWSHLANIAAPTLVVVALVADRIDRRLHGQVPLAAYAWRLGFVGLVIGTALATARFSFDLRRWYGEPMGQPRASLYVSKDQVRLYHAATKFIERCAAPGDRIFVAPDMPILYFLTGRYNPSPFDMTIPGSWDDALIVDRLEATRTQCVVYSPAMFPQFAPFHELFPQLYNYLDQHYRPVAVLSGGEATWYGLRRRT
jgi:hypothetical protein